MIGTILEKYEVIEKIGEGGMATVYRGRHTTLDRTVAIKVMHPHLTSSEKNRARFEREARAIESLRHENILRIYDYSGPGSERCFIVTEFISGPTLRALLDEVGAMMSEPAALVARELCLALQTAHQRGIIHRDIKPENVMLDRGGRVKLMDFGIARLADDSQVTMTGTLVGSPAYMSPEQATGEALDPRSDLFALGTVMYRMVTGTLPFRGANPSVVLKNIIDTTFEDPMERVPSLAHEVAQVIRRCLGQTPADRYSSAAEILVELDAFLASVGIDPAAPGEWDLAGYLLDPEGYEGRLQEHLVARLIARGRSEVEAGKTACALRTFNRVLTLDEDNAEVVQIIESMRPPVAEGRRRTGPLVWIAPLLIAAVAAGALALRTDGFRTWRRSADPEGLLPGYSRVAVPPSPIVPFAEAAPRAEPDEPATPAATPEPTTRPTPEPTGRPVPTPPPPTPQPSATPTPTPAPEPTPDRIAMLQGTGQIRVTSPRQWVAFTIDGKEYPPTPNPAHIELRAGRHVLRITGPLAVEPQETELIVEPDSFAVVELNPVYKPCVLLLEGFDDGSVILVDGAAAGTFPSTDKLVFDDFGSYEVVVKSGDLVVLSRLITAGTNQGDLNPGAPVTLTP